LITETFLKSLKIFPPKIIVLIQDGNLGILNLSQNVLATDFALGLIACNHTHGPRKASRIIKPAGPCNAKCGFFVWYSWIAEFGAVPMLSK
jgi:hypothetical protein